MAAKRVPVGEHKVATLVHLSQATRIAVEKIADALQVSISEVGRAAMEKFVKQNAVAED